MAEIAFILLCHKDPEGIISQANRLTEAGDYIAIHFDARARPEDFKRIHDALDGNPRVAFANRRIRCGWGEWSLVEASLLAVKAAVKAFPAATHFYMLSGDCMPIKTAGYAHDFLDGENADYIESFDFFESDWIKTGLKHERLIYRHYFNERTRKWLFYASFNLQKRLGMTRSIPQDLKIMIGSQWWCLRRRTIEAVLEFCKKRRDVVRFFRTTWIPDETFFQTIVRHLIPASELRSRTLTFLMFTDYGMPVTFFNDHRDMLLKQDFLFARKISPYAADLRQYLGDLYLAPHRDHSVTGEGHRLFQFMTARGRIGRRYAPRFWETSGTIGSERTLLLIACKKWHVAKRLVARVRQATNLPAIDYLFDEEATDLPDLGGITTSRAKRARHARATLRLLFDELGNDRMLICIDPANIDLIRSIASDTATMRLLEIECEFSDEYLAGHAQRVGLAGPSTSAETLSRILPTVRADVSFESLRLREARLPGYARMRQGSAVEENARAIASFLDISLETAHSIAATDHLFSD